MRPTIFVARAPHLLLVGAIACSSSSSVPPKAPEAPANEGLGLSTDKPHPIHNESLQGSSDGVTCEQARAQYVEEIGIDQQAPADLTAADYAAVLNQGNYLASCEVPEASHADVCVAVQNGTAVGVTVSLDPPQANIEQCVSRQVRSLSFPSHPKMDIARVHF
jgi:hypothetical protein